MKFFAILQGEQFASRVMRFKLDQTAESLIKNIITEAVGKFEFANTEIPFSADYTPSQNELFVIDDFNSGIDLKALLENPTGIPILQLEESNGLSLNDIVGIIATDIPNNRVLIQYFEKRNIIELSRSIILRLVNNRYEFVAATSNGISIPTDILAILDSNKKLKFRSFQRLRHIFDMDSYFKEATDEELNNFVNNCSKLEVIQGFDIQEIDDTMIRKKIAIINKADILNNYSVDELKVAAHSIGYPLPLNQSGDKIQLPNNKKQFKDFIEKHGFSVVEMNLIHGGLAPIGVMIAYKK